MSEETTEKEERKYFTYMVRCGLESLYGFTVDDVHLSVWQCILPERARGIRGAGFL